MSSNNWRKMWKYRIWQRYSDHSEGGGVYLILQTISCSQYAVSLVESQDFLTTLSTTASPVVSTQGQLRVTSQQDVSFLELGLQMNFHIDVFKNRNPYVIDISTIHALISKPLLGLTRLFQTVME